MIAKDSDHIMLADLKENKNVIKEIEDFGVKAAFLSKLCD